MLLYDGLMFFNRASIAVGLGRAATLSLDTGRASFVCAETPNTYVTISTTSNTTRTQQLDIEFNSVEHNRAISVFSAADDGQITTSNLTADGLVLDRSPKDWVLWSIDTFDSFEQLRSYTANAGRTLGVNSCGASSDLALGGPCTFGAGTVVTKSLVDEAFPVWPDLQLKVTGRVHFHDRWEGENFHIGMTTSSGNSLTLFTTKHHWCPNGFISTCKANTPSVCGGEEGEQLSTFFSMTFGTQIARSATHITFRDYLTGKTECQASWSIDDIALWVRGGASG